MAAPIGNQFWKLRSKHGRDKLFATPELLWDAACEYFEWCEANPLYKSEAKTVNIGDFKSKVEIVELPLLRAFTIHGLCRYWDCNTVYLNQFEASLADKTDDLSKDFSKVVTRVRDILYEQKFSGAASGLLNPNIIARDLGLADKKELDHKGIPPQTVTYQVVKPDDE
jgi:hypothetical protein